MSVKCRAGCPAFRVEWPGQCVLVVEVKVNGGPSSTYTKPATKISLRGLAHPLAVLTLRVTAVFEASRWKGLGLLVGAWAAASRKRRWMTGWVGGEEEEGKGWGVGWLVFPGGREGREGEGWVDVQGCEALREISARPSEVLR